MAILRAEPSEGVRIVAVDCDEDREERLDGIDDDCDGTIDEGHAQPTDAVLTFRAEASVRLSVRDQAGQAVHEAVASCTPGGFAQLSISRLPAGEYALDVSRLSGCGDEGEMPVAVALSMAEDTQKVLGATVKSGEDTALANLVIGPSAAAP